MKISISESISQRPCPYPVDVGILGGAFIHKSISVQNTIGVEHTSVFE